MADIELVIKVDERDVDFVIKNFKPTGYGFIPLHIQTEFVSAILNGVPLPKGHGTLKDADELYSIFKKNCDAYNIDNLSFISDMDMNFDLALTIIEADK